MFWSSSPGSVGLPSNITDSEQLDQFSFGLCAYSSAVVLVNLKLWFQVTTIFRKWNDMCIMIYC